MGQKTESKKNFFMRCTPFFSPKNKQKAKEDKWFISQFMSCIFCNVTQLTRLNNGHTSKAHPIPNKSFKNHFKLTIFEAEVECIVSLLQCLKIIKNVSTWKRFDLSTNISIITSKLILFYSKISSWLLREKVSWEIETWEHLRSCCRK